MYYLNINSKLFSFMYKNHEFYQKQKVMIAHRKNKPLKKNKIKILSYYAIAGRFVFTTKFLQKKEDIELDVIENSVLIDRLQTIKCKKYYAINSFYVIYAFKANSYIMDWIKENLQYPVLIKSHKKFRNYDGYLVFFSYNDMLQFKLKWL